MQSSNWPGETKGQQLGIETGLQGRLMGQAVALSSRETGVTCENCRHYTVPEQDVSSPTFNSGMRGAKGIKHAPKVFEGAIFQLLFSMADDSVVQFVPPSDAIKRESQRRKRSFPSSVLEKQKLGKFKADLDLKPVFAWEINLSILTQRWTFLADLLQHTTIYQEGRFQVQLSTQTHHKQWSAFTQKHIHMRYIIAQISSENKTPLICREHNQKPICNII